MRDERERRPWDRRPGESSRAHAAFLAYRDLGPSRTHVKLSSVGVKPGTARTWGAKHDWVARCALWDDHVHMLEDTERLESIRSMHSNHSKAARAIQAYALAALQRLNIEAASPADVARLLELGTRLERATLTTSVEELQAQSGTSLAGDDPWSRVAREMSGGSVFS